MWKSFSHITRKLSLFSPHFSSSSRPPSPYFVRRSHFVSANSVCVWWDSDKCKLPAGFDITELAPTLTAALTTTGIKGPIRIIAFGDLLLFSKANRDNLESTGIHFLHFPKLIRDVDKYRFIYSNASMWVHDNLPPAHLFFICGTTVLAGFFQRLRMRNYNILIASNDSPVELTSSATFMWDWDSLISGEKLIGIRTNSPPDGSSVPWYGHFDVPIVDPFPNSTPDTKVRTGPKTVLKQIPHILQSHSDGIPFDHLLSELVNVNQKYYGRKKLSKIILSFPKVLQMETSDDGETVVRSVKYPEPFEPIAMPSILSGGDKKAEVSVCTRMLGGETESTNSE